MPGLYQLSKPEASDTLKSHKKRNKKRKGPVRSGAQDGSRKLVHHRSGGVRSLSEPEYRAGKP
jgi:hypothetical protein